MKTFKCESAELHYKHWDCDAGPRLVWVHGWANNHTHMQPLQDGLVGEAEHIMVDLPGFGGASPIPQDPDAWDSMAYAKLLDDFLKTLPKRETIFITHSYGGRVLIQLASHFQHDVDKAVLIASPGLKRKRSPAWHIKAKSMKVLGKILGASDKVLNTKLKESFRKHYGSTDYKKSGEMLPVFIKAVKEDLTDAAKKVSIPVMLIYGADDTFSPPYFGPQFEKLMPQATCHILPGFDHHTILTGARFQIQTLIRGVITS